MRVSQFWFLNILIVLNTLILILIIILILVVHMPHVSGKRLQPGNAVLGRWMGREQTVHTQATEWVDDKHMRHCRIALRTFIDDCAT